MLMQIGPQPKCTATESHTWGNSDVIITGQDTWIKVEMTYHKVTAFINCTLQA